MLQVNQPSVQPIAQWPRMQHYNVKVERLDTTTNRLVDDSVVERVTFPHTVTLQRGVYYNVITEGVDAEGRHYIVESRKDARTYTGKPVFHTKR